jgi:hypothetical protein
VLDHLTNSAAMVISDLGETIVQNPFAIALTGDDSRHRASTGSHSRTHVADLRATAARRHGDPDVVALVEQLTAAVTS